MRGINYFTLYYASVASTGGEKTGVQNIQINPLVQTNKCFLRGFKYSPVGLCVSVCCTLIPLLFSFPTLALTCGSDTL